MSSFKQSVKYLDYVHSREATIDEAKNTLLLFDKQFGLEVARDIKKINTYVVLSPFVVISDYNGELLFQYNFQAQSDFYLLTPVYYTKEILVCIKYRIGRNVYRYFIYGSQKQFLNNSFDVHTF